MCTNNVIVGITFGLAGVFSIILLVKFCKFFIICAKIYQYNKAISVDRIHMYTAKEDFDNLRKTVTDDNTNIWRFRTDNMELKAKVEELIRVYNVKKETKSE